MAEIDRLTVVFDARFDQMEAKLNKVIRSNYAAADKVEKKWKSANDNISKGALGGALDALSSRAPGAAAGLTKLGGAGLVAAAAIGAVTVAAAAARNAMAFADEIGDAAQKIGVTTDTLQEFRYAIHQVGGEAGDADEALGQFTQTLGKAQVLGTAKNLPPFKALGLDPKELGDVDNALKVVLERLGRVQSEAQRQALAKALGLEKFIPLAREGATKIDELREAARRLGYVMDADLIKKAGDANDKLEDLQQIIKVQLNSALVEIAPVILEVANALADAAKATRFFFDKLNELNTWAANHDVLAMFDWANNAGKATGEFLGTDKIGKAIQGQSKPKSRGYTPEMFGLTSPGSKPLPPFDPIDQSSGGGGSKGRKARGPSQADVLRERSADVNEQLARASADVLDAMASLTGGITERAKLESDIVTRDTQTANEALHQQRLKIDADKTLTDAQKGQLADVLEQAQLQNIKTRDLKLEKIDRDATADLEENIFRDRQEIGKYYDEILSIELGNARTAKERRALELKILEHKQAEERAEMLARQERERVGLSGFDLEKRLNQQAAERASQGDLFVNQTADANRRNLGPLADYFDKLPQTIDDVNERLETMAASGLSSVVDGLAGVAAGFNSLGDVAKSVLRQLTYDLTKLNLETALGMNAGGGQGGGGLLGFLKGGLKLGAAAFGGVSGGSFLSGAPADVQASFAGLFAEGTNNHPGGLSIVGEKGPEFVNIPRGAQVIPNDILRSMSKGRGSTTTYAGNTYNLAVHAAPGMTPADTRRTATQLHAELRRQIGGNGRRGF